MHSPDKRDLISHAATLAVGIAIGGLGVYFLQTGLQPSFQTVGVVDAAEVSAPHRTHKVTGTAIKKIDSDYRVKLSQILAANDKAFKADDLRKLGAEAAQSNVTDALKLADGIAAEKDRIHFLRGVFEVWATTEPKAAAEYALSHFKPGELQSEMVQATLGKWGGTNPHDAFAWAEANLKGPVKQGSINALVGQWTKASPEAAAQWYVKTGNTSQSLMDSIVGTWANSNPAAAAKWVESLPDKANRDYGRLALARELAASDPGKALNYIQPYLAGGGGQQLTKPTDGATKPVDSTVPLTTTTTPTANPTATVTPPTSTKGSPPVIADNGSPISKTTPGKSQPDTTTRVEDPTPDLVPDVMGPWAMKNPQEAAENLSRFPEGKAREEAAATLASIWATSDIEAAVRWSSSITNPKLQSTIVQQLGTTWGAIDPDQAVAWLGTLPPDIAKNGYRGAYNSWASTDPVGLTQWINERPASTEMDLARRSLGDTYAATDPVTAIDLAMGISAPNVQADAVSQYYNRWQKKDSAAANDWLQTTWQTLPVATQTKLSNSSGLRPR